MFWLATAVGAYGLLIFFLGILGFLSRGILLTVDSVFLVVVVGIICRNLGRLLPWKANFSKTEVLTSLVLGVFFLVNLIGALGPEIFYDALWYHLTLPKIYLETGKVFVIPGNLFYYSGMPQLLEMIFTGVMGVAAGQAAKLVHYLFGVVTTMVIFVYGRKYIGRGPALVAALVFYSSLGVAWLSTTANIDLGRTFFEAMAFFIFLDYWEQQQDKYLYMSGLLAGLAVGSKYLAIGGIGILSVLILVYARKERLTAVIKFLVPAVAVASPWFLFAYLSTGNPVYPLFSGLNVEKLYRSTLSVSSFFGDFFRLSNGAKDWVTPLSPIFLIAFPLWIFAIRKFSIARIAFYYFFLAYVTWFLTPRTGGSRFIIPYLPAASILVASILNLESKPFKLLSRLLIVAVFIVTAGNILIRTIINAKVIPVLIGRESAHEYLNRNLDFKFDFYDTDGSLGKKLTKRDLVYVAGGHNFYYVDFPFIHESFYQGQKIDYVLTENSELPSRFQTWTLVYENRITSVKLYKPPDSR